MVKPTTAFVTDSAGRPAVRVTGEPGRLPVRFARRDFPLLDFCWMHQRALPMRASLRQLLDPGNALHQMSAPQQLLTSAGVGLPDFSLLNTRQHSAVIQTILTSEAPTPQTTLDDSVIEGLIQALYDALPEGLDEPLIETTNSGNRIGRHGHVSRPRKESLWVPTSVPRADTQAEEPEEEVEALPPALPPEPRPYVIGAVPDGLFQVTLRSLPELDVSLPAENAGTNLATHVALGSGEACFLRAQSALWTWRTHRQVNQEMHVEGPPVLGRNTLIEQRIGPVTLLLGCRVTDMSEEDRQWGFTLGSLEGQVLQSKESFLVEWQADDAVVFSLRTQHQFAMPNLTFLGPVYSALRRKFKQGYIRNLLELTSD